MAELIEHGARVYAQALYEAADEADRVDQVNRDLADFTAGLVENRAVAGALLNPRFPREGKERVAARLLADADPLVRNGVLVLMDHNRMAFLPDVQAAFHELATVREQVLEVEVTTAIPVGEDLLRGIEERIAGATGMQVRATASVDPAILGGLVLRGRGVLLDASVRRRLQEIHRALCAAPLAEQAA